ncbi:MAG: MarR family transcriptional regulator [Sterolibacterium sp.]
MLSRFTPAFLPLLGIPVALASQKNASTRITSTADGTLAPARSEEIANTRQRDLRLGFLIHDVSRMRRKAFDQFMRPLGITRAQWRVITYLSRQDGMMQTQLAELLEVGKASLGNLIDRLESAGWIERVADPTDKRAKRIYLAHSSQQLLAEIEEYEHAFNEQMLRNLTGDDRDTLMQLLSVIKQSLNDMDMVAAPSILPPRRIAWPPHANVVSRPRIERRAPVCQ